MKTLTKSNSRINLQKSGTTSPDIHSSTPQIDLKDLDFSFAMHPPVDLEQMEIVNVLK